MKLLIIIPAFNEAANIVRVIESIIQENKDWHILVVNDCSTDNTAELAAATGKATLISLPCNLGIGGAVQTGIMYAKSGNYDLAIKFDGDGQHIATEINKLIEPILKKEADVVIGSRFKKTHTGFRSTFIRRIGIQIISMVSSLLIRKKITDSTSGFRAYNRKAIDFLERYYPAFDYPEPEEIILLARNNFKLEEVSADMQERLSGKSTISALRSFYYMTKVLLAILMVSIRKKIIKTKP